jgi:hypothetical protein
MTKAAPVAWQAWTSYAVSRMLEILMVSKYIV